MRRSGWQPDALTRALGCSQLADVLLALLGPPEACRGLVRTCQQWRYSGEREAYWAYHCQREGFMPCIVDQEGRLLPGLQVHPEPPQPVPAGAPGGTDPPVWLAPAGASPREPANEHGSSYRTRYLVAWSGQAGPHRFPLHLVQDIVVDGSGPMQSFDHLLNMVAVGPKGVGKCVGTTAPLREVGVGHRGASWGIVGHRGAPWGTVG